MPERLKDMSVDIPPEALAALERIRHEAISQNTHMWQQWEDDTLLKYWMDPHYTKREFCRDVLKLSYNTCLARYRRLTSAP